MIRILAVLVAMMLSTLAYGAEPVRLPTSATMDFIKSADSIWVYRYEPEKLEAAEKLGKKTPRLREIKEPAKGKLIALLADSAHYYTGVYRAEEHYAFVLEFRSGGETLTLNVGFSLVAGSFRGKELSGVLDDSTYRALVKWRQKYAEETFPPMLKVK